MKVLKILEKIFLVIATVFAIMYFATFGAYNYGDSSYFSIVSLFSFPTILVLFMIVLGMLLLDNKSDIASRVGMALLLTGFVSLFAATIVSSSVFESVVIGAIAWSSYFISLLIRGIEKIVLLVKPRAIDSDNPDNDETIQNIIKWKNLNQQGIITDEEFEIKRNQILKIVKTEEIEEKNKAKKA